MIIPPRLLDGTAFVYYTARGGGIMFAGTAFKVEEPTENHPDMFFHFLVTARHVIEDARRNTYEDHIIVRFNMRDGSSLRGIIPFKEFYFHPEDDSEMTGFDWLEAADRERYDIAVCPVPPELADRSGFGGPSLGRNGIVSPELIEEDHIRPGDEVFMVGGFYAHLGEDRNVPIVRGGTIASMPDTLIASGLGPMHGYLLETRSIGGLSGSPVYWTSGLFRVDANNELHVLSASKTRLLGLVHGHFQIEAKTYTGARENLNEGISIIAPVRHIIETVRGAKLMAVRRAAERHGG